MSIAALLLAAHAPFNVALDDPPGQRAGVTPTARYVVRLADPAAGAVDVELRLGGLDPAVESELRLGLPERFAFATLDAPRLRGLQLESTPGGAAAIAADGPWQWNLVSSGAASVTLTWTVPLDHRSLPEFVGDEYEAPYLTADHGLLVGGALFIAPLEPAPAAVEVRFELPADWAVTAPWPESRPGVFTPGRPEFLHDDMIAVGAWDLVEQRIGDFELAIAFAPGQVRLRDMVAPRIPPIVEAELELFGSLPNERYLFLFVDPQPGGYGGSPKSNSMTLFVAPDLPAEFAAAGVEHLIAHEYYHTWAKARVQLPDELRWVNEGFTDWYAYVVPWRLGLSDDAELLATLAEKLSEFEGAQARFGGSLLDAGGPAFFEGGDAYATTYAGGLVVAALCDAALRASPDSEGLDQLMRDFIHDPRWDDGTQPTTDDFFALLQRHGGPKLAGSIQRIVEPPTAPDLVAAFAAVGVDLQRAVEPVQLTPRANFTGTRVDAIDPKGCGALIGLRTGDALREVNGEPVADAAAIRRAFRTPLAGRLEIVLDRPGSAQPITIDAAIPEAATFTIEPGLIGRFRP